jgi:hypothetical protein
MGAAHIIAWLSVCSYDAPLGRAQQLAMKNTKWSGGNLQKFGLHCLNDPINFTV